MELTGHLKNVAQHKPTRIPQEKFPYYIVNRFFSFTSPSYAMILNSFGNYQHWQDSSNWTQQQLLKTLLPKTAYNYKNLFGGYVKQPANNKDPKEQQVIDYVCRTFDVPKSKAKFYLNGNEILIDKMGSPNNSHNIRYDFKIKPKIII